MSTTRTLKKQAGRELSCTSKYDNYDIEIEIENPKAPLGFELTEVCNLTAKDALEVAVGILYSVWTYQPDEAGAVVNQLSASNIPDIWNEICNERRTNGNR